MPKPKPDPKHAIPQEDWLYFPQSAAFQFKPLKPIIPFDAYVPQGVYVPVQAPASQNDKGSKLAAINPQDPLDADDFADILGSLDVEVDGSGRPTLDLTVEHDLARPGGRMNNNAKVLKLPRGDAWLLGKEGVYWSEPMYTNRGEFGIDKPPFHRAIRALTQFFNSRRLALTRRHHVFATEFRSITKLQATVLGPHIPGGYIPDLNKPMSEEDDEATPFIRDMEGTMKKYWKTAMEGAANGWNFLNVLNAFEIVNSYLHYLHHYKIFSPTSESWLFESLTRTCQLSRLAYKQMRLATMLYENLLVTGSYGMSWQMMGGGNWGREEMDWEVAEKKAEAILGVVPEEETKEEEKEKEGKVDGKDGERKEDGKRKEEGEKGMDDVQPRETEEWNKNEKTAEEVVALLTREESQAKLSQMVSPINSSGFTALIKLSRSIGTIIEVYPDLDAMSSSLASALQKNSIAKRYVGMKMKLRALPEPGAEGEQEAKREEEETLAKLIFDRGQGLNDDDLQALKGMEMVATFTGVGTKDGGEVITWFAGDVKSVLPCLML